MSALNFHACGSNHCHHVSPNRRRIISPLPAGEGRGEGEPQARECHGVHAQGECLVNLDRPKSTLRPRKRPPQCFFPALITFLLFTLTTFAAQNSLTDAQLLQIKFDQKPGSQVSPDLLFRDETGKQVRLGDYFGKRPIVLIPGYYSCPMLCTLIMQGVIESFRDLRWSVGEQFDVIFVSIDPREGPEQAAAKKNLYLRDYGRRGTEDGWHFLVAASGAPHNESPPPHDTAIQTLADEIGFRFAYDPGLKQFAHPAGFVVLTPDGKVAHYFFGVTFSAKEVDVALHHADARKTDSPVRDFILLCCEYSPLRGKYGNLIMDTVRVGGMGMVMALGLYFIRPIRRKPAD